MLLFKKIKLLILSCIVGTGFAGCSSSEELKSDIEDPVEILNFAKTVNKFESLHNNITTNIKGILNNQQFDTSIVFDSLYSSEQQKNVLKTTVSISENEDKSFIYFIKEGDIPYRYINKDNNWSKEQLSLEEFNNVLIPFSEPMYFDELIAIGNVFNVIESDSIYTLKGQVKVSDIEETLKYIGILNMLSIINLDLDDIDKEINVDLKLDIEKGTGYLKNFNINVIEEENESIAKTIVDLINLPLDSFKLEIINFEVDLNFDQANTVDNIEIPQEILDIK